jgi:hypothetical protein
VAKKRHTVEQIIGKLREAEIAVGKGLTVPQAAAQSGSNGWESAVVPYLVAAGMDGSVTVKGIEADVDVPFGDIIDNLDLAAMVHFDMRNEHWVLMSDLFYVDLEGSNDVALGTATVAIQ